MPPKLPPTPAQKAAARILASDDGKLLLDELKRITDQTRVFPQTGAEPQLWVLEGQRTLIGRIEAMAKEGSKQ